MKISMISTVRDEEKNIRAFLDSILRQTKKPDELIVVDGGSKDRTYEILKEYSKKYRWIKTYQLIGVNIAKGRNYAINKSVGEIIFTSDCSTIFEKDWVKKIFNGFDENIDVVFGTYFVKPKTLIEKFLVSRLPKWNKINPDKFLPSNRHVAFKRVVWKKVGGFPEHIRRADDNWFHEKAHKLNFKYKLIKDAKVEWLLDRTLKTTLRLAFLDSKTEGFAFMFIKRKIYWAEICLFFSGIAAILLGILVNIHILMWFAIAGLIFLILFAGLRTYIKTKSIGAGFIGLIVMPLLYFAHVFGVFTGMIQKIYRGIE